ncbi:hypothetical protein ACHAXM_008129 [Skeletonema potamos]
MDSDGKFPISKIKAQLLRDSDVGRVSTKAVELINACSALFVSDLARSTEASHNVRKRNSTSKTNTTAKDVTLVTLAQIKKSVKSKKEYTFLSGVLDGVTEKNAFQYDAAAARKRKRMEDTKNMKQKNNSRQKSKSVPNPPAEAGGTDGSNEVENRALREAIKTETSATSQNTGDGRKREIIEDEDDYD